MSSLPEKTGPFGFVKGMKLADVPGDIVEVAPFKYKTALPPKPHSAFESYILKVTPIAGLSWIKALGKPIRTNGFGYDVLAAFDSMESKLMASYGRRTRHDSLLSGSIWDEPRDWMQALERGERLLASQWNSESAATLPIGISSIFLVANASDTDEGYIAIEYSLDNSDEGDREIAAAEDDAL